MRNAHGLLFIFGILVGCNDPQTRPSGEPISIKSEVPSLRDSVQAFGEAWAKHDLKTLDALLAPEYVHTDIQGHVLRRAEWLAYAQSQQHGSNLTFRDLEVTDSGNFGVVLGANDISGGSIGVSSIRFTQVWRRTEGGWKRVAFQATLVK